MSTMLHSTTQTPNNSIHSYIHACMVEKSTEKKSQTMYSFKHMPTFLFPRSYIQTWSNTISFNNCAQ